MWVLTDLIDELPERPRRRRRVVDLDEELRRRLGRASERERIGLRGEHFVLERERARLMVSAKGDERAFDVRSFDSDGRERHIEVKSTTRPRALDDGFWLAEVERAYAERDDNWCIYRVWHVDGSPSLATSGTSSRGPQKVGR